MKDSLDKIIRENKFESCKNQIRNFITHLLGFQPEDMTGGEFANEFTWKTKNAELIIVFFYGCSWRNDKDYFWYSLRVNGNRTDGEYRFDDHLYCRDEEEITKIIQPFKDCVENRTTLNITSTIERIPFTNRSYVIQAFKDGYWSDVMVSRSNISTANKKARHYRNQNDCETRVVEIRENVSYTYEYEVVIYEKRQGDEARESEE